MTDAEYEKAQRWTSIARAQGWTAHTLALHLGFTPSFAMVVNVLEMAIEMSKEDWEVDQVLKMSGREGREILQLFQGGDPKFKFASWLEKVKWLHQKTHPDGVVDWRAAVQHY